MRDTFRIHAAYVIAFLIASNIIVLTVKWGGVTDLVGYLNFASTLTSLVLAVLAIVYAYLSNASVGQQVATLRSVTDEMRTVAAGVSASAGEILNRFETLPTMFADVGAKVNETHEYVHQLYEDRGKQAAPTSSTDRAAESKLSHQTRFLRLASIDGLRALYLMSLAYRSKIAINLPDALARVKLDDDYAYGFLIACVSFGTIDVNLKDDVWNVVGIDAEIDEKLKAELVAKEEAFHREWAGRVGRTRTRERIEAYIAGEPLPDDDPLPSADR